MDLSNKLTHVFFADDWEGLYIENELISEGHSLRLDEVLKWLIDNDVSMGDLKYCNLQLSKHHKNYSHVCENEIEDVFNCSLPQSLKEYIEKCEELGYNVELKYE